MSEPALSPPSLSGKGAGGLGGFEWQPLPQAGRGESYSVRTGFETHRHGFPFVNGFAPGTPVMQIPTPWGTIPVGDLANGLCGGFVFAALDYFHRGRPIPRDFATPGLFRYIRLRLWNSFNGPHGGLRVYSWTCRSDEAVHRLTAEREWPRLMERMANDRRPVPLMLIRPRTRRPWEVGKNHQVLATGFDYDASSGRAVVHIYDPNHPAASESDPPVTLSFDTRNGEPLGADHSREGPNVRGFFVNRYTAKTPPRAAACGVAPSATPQAAHRATFSPHASSASTQNAVPAFVM